METSVDVIRTQIRNAQPILKALDERMEAIEFDPREPSSVAAATASVQQIVEDLMTPFKTNPVLGPLAIELKSHYLDNIRFRVSEARKA
ncbi:hypothetical protein IFR09_10740 [Pseudomonas syringae]|nr:hypothetical protein [Pseudomonas syringae]MBD8577254.1 hypothetical protein [Pseudomonas syringae]MBD8790854.1 hypothetical protein [Pseudomonas syringae]MBD8802010.1 hypothetical protein [Pseudomonas syringae]MBD8811640.1 hypothetical protein [Pseudomonas syringae]